MRILALTRYGRSGATSRLRILQYLPALHEAGIDVTPAPLPDDKYLEALYAGRRAVDSIAVGHVRRLLALLAARCYDVVGVTIECLSWLSALVRQAKHGDAQILFWDDAGFRAEAVHGQPSELLDQTPIVYRPRQWQSESAASAVGPRAESWLCTYAGGLTGELSVVLLRRSIHRRRWPVRLIPDGLPAHRTRLVRGQVNLTGGKLSRHFFLGYAPELNSDELAWSYVTRTGSARRPLQQGMKLAGRIDQRLVNVCDDPKLDQTLYQAPPVANIRDC